MAEALLVELESGRQILIGGDGTTGGREKISASAPKEPVGRLAEAMDALGDVLETVQSKIAALPKQPGKIEIEFGVSLTSKANLWIVSGDGKAEFKVKLSWENKPDAKG